MLYSVVMDQIKSVITTSCPSHTHKHTQIHLQHKQANCIDLFSVWCIKEFI